MEDWMKKYYKQRFKVLNEEATKHADTLELMISEMEMINEALHDTKRRTTV